MNSGGMDFVQTPCLSLKASAVACAGNTIVAFGNSTAIVKSAMNDSFSHDKLQEQVHCSKPCRHCKFCSIVVNVRRRKFLFLRKK